MNKILKGQSDLSGFFPEMKMVIFGDFKKHTFKYNFLCVANPVENYEVKNTAVVCEELAHHLPDLNAYLKHYSQQLKAPLPQIVVLRNYKISSFK